MKHFLLNSWLTTVAQVLFFQPLGRGNYSLILRLFFWTLFCSLSDKALGLDTCPFCHILIFCHKVSCWPPQDDYGALRRLSSPFRGEAKHMLPWALSPLLHVGSLKIGPCPCLLTLTSICQWESSFSLWLDIGQQTWRQNRLPSLMFSLNSSRIYRCVVCWDSLLDAA